MSLTKKECASLGGRAVYKKYGSEYMSKIGKRGYEKFFEHYYLYPVEQNKFAIIDRETNKIVSLRG